MTTLGVRHLRRTFLYVPGSEERKLVKAQTLGADAVILDLEDSVAPERKADARERISGLLPSAARAQRREVDQVIHAEHEGKTIMFLPLIRVCRGGTPECGPLSSRVLSEL
jgi:hypothetical protein